VQIGFSAQTTKIASRRRTKGAAAGDYQGGRYFSGRKSLRSAGVFPGFGFGGKKKFLSMIASFYPENRAQKSVEVGAEFSFLGTAESGPRARGAFASRTPGRRRGPFSVMEKAFSALAPLANLRTRATQGEKGRNRFPRPGTSPRAKKSSATGVDPLTNSRGKNFPPRFRALGPAGVSALDFPAPKKTRPPTAGAGKATGLKKTYGGGGGDKGEGGWGLF